MKYLKITTFGLAMAIGTTAISADIVATDAYRWHGDTITQG